MKKFFKHLTKKAVLTLLAIIIIGAPILYLTILNSKPASAAWYNDNWLYRAPIPITAHTAAENNVYITVTLDTATPITAGKMQSDCGDLRFTKQNGELLPYFINASPGCNNAATTIQVNFDFFPAGAQTIYYYYGNPSAENGNPNPSTVIYYTGAADGHIESFSPVWSTVHAASTGDVFNTDVASKAFVEYYTDYDIGRFFLPVDTSGIPDTATITAATLYVYLGNATDADNDGDDWVNVVQTSQASPTALVSGDFDQAGAVSNPTEGSTRKDLTGLATGQYHSFALNATGLTWVSKTGYTLLGLREGHDALNSAFVGASSDNQFNISTSEETGTSQDPYLEVTYYVPSTFSTEASNYTVGSTGSEEKAPSPTLYWKFDDPSASSGLAARDSSSNGNTGTLGGTTVPTWQTEDRCMSGKCLYFDGSTSKVTGSKISIGVQTISFWIRPNTIASQGLINLDGGTHKISTNASGVISATGFTSPAYYINGVATATPTLTINTWNHVEITTGTGFNSTATFTIGTDGTNFIKGFADEVKFYDYARTAAQVKTDFAGRSVSKGASARFGGGDLDYLSKGLVGYWKLDESSGNASDSSGNGTTLTNANSTAFATGKFGNGADFESASFNYQYAADNTALSLTGDLTMSAWIKPESVTASTQFDIAGKFDQSNESYLLSQFGDEIRVYIDSSSNYVTTDSANLATGTWYHVLAIYKASAQTVTIYLNGVAQAATVTGTIPSSIGDDSGRFHIGGEDSTGSGTVSIAQNSDDAKESSGTMALTGASLESDATTEKLGFRFQNVTIPQGATVNTAYLTLYFNSSTLDEPNHPIYAEAADNSSTFTTGSNDITNRSLTSATATWSSTDLGAAGSFNSPELKSLAQEVINRASWASGNAMTFIIIGSASATRDFQVAALDHATDPAGTFTYDTSTNFYDGVIDETRVYNRALSPKEISDLYNWAPGPVGYWKMDDKVSGNSQTLVDSSGNGNNGTTNYGANAAGMDCTKPGKYGGGCSFDGTDDYVDTGNATNFDFERTDSFSASAWIKTSTTGNFQPVMGNEMNDSTLRGWMFYIYDTNVMAFDLISNDVTTNLINIITPTTVTDGNWHYVTVTYDGSSTSAGIKIFVDGKLQTNTAAGTLSATTVSTRNLEIGRRLNGNLYLNGLIDDVKVYSYARSAKQVVSDMNAGHPAVGSPVGSNLIQLKFDEGYGTTANNSGNGGSSNNGTVNSGTWTNSGKFGKGVTITGSSGSNVSINDFSY